ncbi:unnamed protein product [Sphagnum balticum]
MDMNFHQAGMPRLVGPAGMGGTGTGPGGPALESQPSSAFLPNPIPSECTSAEIEIILLIHTLNLSSCGVLHLPLIDHSVQNLCTALIPHHKIITLFCCTSLEASFFRQARSLPHYFFTHIQCPDLRSTVA